MYKVDPNSNLIYGVEIVLTMGKIKKLLLQFKKQVLFLIVFIFLAIPTHAQDTYRSSRYLTAQEIQRVKVVKELLYGIDTKSLKETIDELEKTKDPQINLAIKEAMAKTYTYIVEEINVEGQKKKEWLYSMVCLNMAYLQFGGNKGTPGSTTELNRLIRQKLIKYLPPNVLKQHGFFYSLE